MSSGRTAFTLTGVRIREAGTLAGAVEEMMGLLAALQPPGRVVRCEVGHEMECPCGENGVGMEGCTCEEVELRFEAHEISEILPFGQVGTDLKWQ